MKTSILTFIAAASLPLVAMAAENTAEPVTVIKAAHMIDTIAGKRRDNVMVVVRGDRIESVGKASDAIPDGAHVIDLGGQTIMPGLVDSHTHMTGAPFYGYEALQVSIPRAALYGAKNARITLLAGITTVRDVGAEGYSDVALRDAINDGDVPGPRMLVAGTALGMTGGHCDSNLLPYGFHYRAEGVADGPWAVRAKVREVIKYGADLIKFCATGGVLSKGDSPGAQQYSFEEMKAIVDEAHLHGRRVAAHAHGTNGIKTAIRAGVDSIEHASILDDEAIKMAKEHGTYFSMDIYNDDYILSEGLKNGMLPESIEKERAIGLVQRQSFRRAYKAGVKMAFGTDEGVYPHGDNGKQMAKMVEWGMSPMVAIQTATMGSATLLGMQDDIGAITPGRYADIIAVDGNPLKDAGEYTRVRFVMKGGEVYKGE
ncbi:MAG: Xaa-Pro dipeptidase [Robiginitomaculum sp.]|nr:MAG: Xaa-Pro dipeptidase [Robiginitomaculum sp.]